MTTTTTQSMRPPVANASGKALFEGLSVDLVPAPLFKRYLAFAIDMGITSAILYGVVLVLFIATVAIVGSGAVFGLQAQAKEFVQAMGAAGLIALIVVVLLFLLFTIVVFDGYFVWFEFHKGATPGKKLMGMRVVSLRGARLTLGQCLLREAFRSVDCFLILPGLVAVTSTAKRQRLGDLVSGTMVIYSASSERAAEFLYLPQERYVALAERLAPTPPGPALVTEYLGFAYPAFLMKRTTPDEATLARWDEVALRHVHVKEAETIERADRLLFFAELCFQTSNGKNTVR